MTLGFTLMELVFLLQNQVAPGGRELPLPTYNKRAEHPILRRSEECLYSIFAIARSTLHNMQRLMTY